MMTKLQAHTKSFARVITLSPLLCKTRILVCEVTILGMNISLDSETRRNFLCFFRSTSIISLDVTHNVSGFELSIRKTQLAWTSAAER